MKWKQIREHWNRDCKYLIRGIFSRLLNKSIDNFEPGLV